MKRRLAGMLAAVIGFVVIGAGCGGYEYEPEPESKSIFRIEVLDGSFPDTHQWDAFDGPDPYVCMKTVSTDEFCTSTRKNTWSPNWLEKSPEFYSQEGLDNIRLEVVDEDPDEDDVGFQDTTWLSRFDTPYEETLESKGGVSVRLRVTKMEF
jgi:hypothetical protein